MNNDLYQIDSTQKSKKAYLILEDGSIFEGLSFGADSETNGEVVFNTGMVGYPETFSDPSYKAQILTLTYPMIGNYGVPKGLGEDLSNNFESTRFHISGLIVYEIAVDYSHWNAFESLSKTLANQNIPAIYGIDTRELTKKLRMHGTMRGMISFDKNIKLKSADKRHVVSEVSITEPIEYNKGKKKVALVDCGCKSNILRSLLNRNLSVIRIPWNYNVSNLNVDGFVFSNGPGDPIDCDSTIESAKIVLEKGIPALGICLGHQMLSLAAGAKTYKLPFGHRSQNQPCKEINSKRCFITSQNHGYAVDDKTLPQNFEPWFVNLNDNTNEGMRNDKNKIMSVQFHPEATPGPVDTAYIFDEFVRWL